LCTSPLVSSIRFLASLLSVSLKSIATRGGLLMVKLGGASAGALLSWMRSTVAVPCCELVIDSIELLCAQAASGLAAPRHSAAVTILFLIMRIACLVSGRFISWPLAAQARYLAPPSRRQRPGRAP